VADPEDIEMTTRTYQRQCSAAGVSLGRIFAAAAVVVVAGCSPGPMIDRVPTDMGGLPSGAPARSTAPSAFPAVHAMPPARPTAPMSEEDQVKVEKELTTAHDRQTAESIATFKKKADEKAAKEAARKMGTKPAGAGDGQAAGAKTNP
jgi:hypothetical protein